jgi:hypothetical protein
MISCVKMSSRVTGRSSDPRTGPSDGHQIRDFCVSGWLLAIQDPSAPIFQGPNDLGPGRKYGCLPESPVRKLSVCIYKVFCGVEALGDG